MGEDDGGGVVEQSADALTGRGWWQAEQIESEPEPAWLGVGEYHGENYGFRGLAVEAGVRG